MTTNLEEYQQPFTKVNKFFLINPIFYIHTHTQNIFKLF